MDHIMLVLFRRRAEVLRTNKSAFVFYVFILFIQHTNALLRERKAKMELKNSGYGGRTVTDTGYLKTSPLREHLFFRKFFSHHLIFMIRDKIRERMTSTNAVSSGQCYLSIMLATEM